MYGKTGYAPLSVFVRSEMPKHLISEEKLKAAPPRYTGAGGRAFTQDRPRVTYPTFSELNRKPEIQKTSQRKSGAEEYGVTRLSPGTRVEHMMFGEGVILSSKDMGGDVLYEVKFDNFGVKKLMATFAKLKVK